MKRIATATLALVLAAGLTLAGAGSASAGGPLGGGKNTKTQGGGVGCCVDAV